MKKKKKENGEVMLEGIIIVTLTVFLLLWILAVGFIYYQRYLVTAITNDAAAKIAATYYNPDSDIIMGYIEAEDLSDRDLYRCFSSGSLRDTNEEKADAYITYMLEKTNFREIVDSVDVSLELVQDSALRKHVKIKTVCVFNTPFGEALDFFGMSAKTTYEASARADCTDLIDYISTTDFAAYQLSGNGVSSSLIKMINSFLKIFNHKYVKH